MFYDVLLVWMGLQISRLCPQRPPTQALQWAMFFKGNTFLGPRMNDFILIKILGLTIASQPGKSRNFRLLVPNWKRQRYSRK